MRLKHLYKQVLPGVMLCMALAAQSAWAQTTVVGTTPGQFSVNESGAATYSIPIQVPPGVAGMQPQLSLEYNSQGGNGLLGMGWSLSGLSSITRCPRTMAHDGVRGAVNYDMNDRFCLDGQRLMLVSGTYGVSGSEYRTERESFSKVIANGTAGNGPASFTVQTKTGLTMEMGNTADSRIEAQGKATVRTWALNKISDVKTNFMTVNYTEDSVNGDFYPSRIDYAHSSVLFNYASRPDTRLKYYAGSVNSMNSRMTTIVIQMNGAEVKSYQFQYEPSSAINRSRVSSLTECAPALCLTPVIFQTSQTFLPTFQSTSSYTSSLSDAAGWDQPQYYGTIQFADLNGDGLLDICVRGGSGLGCSLNTGAGWLTAAGFSVPMTDAAGWNLPKYYSTIRFVDINGDGLADICARGGAGLACSMSTGTGWQAAVEVMPLSDAAGWDQPQYYGTIQFADLNGDGLLDVCARGEFGLGCSLNTGAGWQAAAGFAMPMTDAAGWNLPKYYSTIRFVDINGDGLADICARGGAGLACSMSTGTGWQAAVEVMPLSDAAGWDQPQYYGTIQFADLNGDGLLDVCARGEFGLGCSLNTGAGWQAAAGFAMPMTDAAGWNLPKYYSTIRFVDINGDGLADICARGGAGLACSMSTGTGWQAAVEVMPLSDAAGWDQPQYYGTIQFADLNGDGPLDVCARGGSGLGCYSNQTSLPQYFKVSSASSVTEIAYASLSKNDIYTKDAAPNASVYPKIDLQYPQYVVGEVKTSNGVGGVNTVQYNYGGLKAEQGTGRGLLGFRWMKSKNLTNNIESYTEFNQNWPFTGTVAKNETRLAGAGNAGLLKRTTNTYAQSPGSAGASVFVYPSQSVEESWDLSGTPYPSTTTSYLYGQSPQYGDPTQIAVSNSEGASKTTANEYWPAITAGGNWILGRLKRATVTSAKP